MTFQHTPLTRRTGTTTQLWRCPSCGYDHIPEEDYSEFYCFACGPMGGESNKCREIQQCDDCGEDQKDCSCCPDCNELECEGCGRQAFDPDGLKG